MFSDTIQHNEVMINDQNESKDEYGINIGPVSVK